MGIEAEIREIVDRETRAWSEKDVEALLGIFHPDMVWPWPPAADRHDPTDWIFVLGRYDRRRWGENWRRLFATHTLVHNRRRTVRVVATAEGDGAFAVVDVDTLWRTQSGRDFHWCGRACKVYTRMEGEWRMIFQTGLLDYARFGGVAGTAGPARGDD
jgi:ketosteroid isomerase-like protein